jgi:uncharacterized membrane protein YbaN (DUF454 family)
MEFLMTIIKITWIALGFVCFGLGTLGVVLPVLPTVPFYMATAYCFAKSSDRLHDWFTGTRLYRKYLDSYVKNRAMTVKTKVSLLTTSSIAMGIGFIMMESVPAARVILFIVWVCHILYFVFRVKTIRESGESTFAGD